MTKKQTFTNLDSWLLDIEKHGAIEVELMVIGNKSDMVDCKNKPEVTATDIAEFTKRTGIPIYLTSAKSGANIDSTFLKLTDTLIEKTKLNINPGNEPLRL